MGFSDGPVAAGTDGILVGIRSGLTFVLGAPRGAEGTRGGPEKAGSLGEKQVLLK